VKQSNSHLKDQPMVIRVSQTPVLMPAIHVSTFSLLDWAFAIYTKPSRTQKPVKRQINKRSIMHSSLVRYKEGLREKKIHLKSC